MIYCKYYAKKSQSVPLNGQNALYFFLLMRPYLMGIVRRDGFAADCIHGHAICLSKKFFLISDSSEASCFYNFMNSSTHQFLKSAT
jgi:hypothetical protein